MNLPIHMYNKMRWSWEIQKNGNTNESWSIKFEIPIQWLLKRVTNKSCQSRLRCKGIHENLDKKRESKDSMKILTRKRIKGILQKKQKIRVSSFFGYLQVATLRRTTAAERQKERELRVWRSQGQELLVFIGKLGRAKSLDITKLPLARFAAVKYGSLHWYPSYLLLTCRSTSPVCVQPAIGFKNRSPCNGALGPLFFLTQPSGLYSRENPHTYVKIVRTSRKKAHISKKRACRNGNMYHT